RGARATPAPALAPDGAPAPPVARRLEFASGGLSGLASLDAGRGGRLLLFPPSGGLLLFTGERTGVEPPARVGGLTIAPAAGGATRVRYRGPMLRFPDTTAFLDLEHGLRRADLVPADVTLDFVPRHAGGAEPGDFGRLAGEATLDGTRFAVDAVAFGEGGAAPAPWPRVRLALHLGAARARSSSSFGSPTASGSASKPAPSTGCRSCVCGRRRFGSTTWRAPWTGARCRPGGARWPDSDPLARAVQLCTTAAVRAA